MDGRYLDAGGNFRPYKELTKAEKEATTIRDKEIAKLKAERDQLHAENHMLKNRVIDPHNTVPTDLGTPAAPTAKVKSQLAGSKGKEIDTKDGAEVTMEMGATPETEVTPTTIHPDEKIKMEL